MSRTSSRRWTALWISLAAAGCLGGYTPAPGGAPPNGGSAAPVGGSSSGEGGGGGTTSSPPPSDMAGSAAPVADLAPPASGTPAPPSAAGDLGVACDKPQSTAGLSSPNGRHNAGAECQGCHAPGGNAPTFYLGGTLYDSVGGTHAVAGATINVTDASGKQVKIVSAQNGNFWTTTPLTYPLTVDASLCPATTPMTATVGGNGACNNCHDNSFRVHVP